MKTGILILALGLAVLDWVVTAKKNRGIEKFAKPLTLIFLILWVITSAIQGKFLSESPFIWLLVGLLFCLAGDIFLFLPPEKWFLIGLIAFLLGHVGYILSFGVSQVSSDQIVPTSAIALAIVISGFITVRRLIGGLRLSGKQRMAAPIVVYSIVISYMLFSAAFKFLDANWSLSEALLLAGGALLFYISDILNAWERFVSKFENDRLIIMMAYHLGQFGIASGMVLHLSHMVAK